MTDIAVFERTSKEVRWMKHVGQVHEMLSGSVSGSVSAEGGNSVVEEVACWS